MITVTDDAAQYITKQLAKNAHKYVRIGVKQAGCSGLKFTVNYVAEKLSEEQIFVSNSIEIIANPEQLNYIDGMTIAFEKNVFSERLICTPPVVKAKAKCGCGESWLFAKEQLNVSK